LCRFAREQAALPLRCSLRLGVGFGRATNWKKVRSHRFAHEWSHFPRKCPLIRIVPHVACPLSSRRFCLRFVLRHAHACRYPLTHHHSRTSVSLIRLGLSHAECVCMCDARVRVTTNARTHNHTPLSYLFVAGSGDRKTVMRGTFLNKLALYSAVCFAGTSFYWHAGTCDRSVTICDRLRCMV